MMPLRSITILSVLVGLMHGCAGTGNWESGDSIASLKGKRVVVEEEHIEGGLEKAIAGYKQFLEQTPEEEMTPEATMEASG